MRIQIETETSLRLDGPPGELSIESAPGESFSPFHMLAASLAACTHLVLHGWALQAKLEAEGLAVGVEWEHREDGTVAGMRMRIEWPGLPEPRRAAAVRAAATCSVHRTLEEAVPISTEVA